MAEKHLRTYRTNGSYTFTAPSKGLFQFYVIGKGGNGGNGRSETLRGGAGGAGGGSGGYAVHEVTMEAGETASIEVSATQTKLICQGNTVLATAASLNSPGTASGANIQNSPGNAGRAGGSGSASSASTAENVVYYGGTGGYGAASVGKYQAAGGTGGRGGTGKVWSVSVTPGNGVSPVTTDLSLGGGGGGGGGAPYNRTNVAGGSGGAGGPGGVIIMQFNSAPIAPPWIDVGDIVLGGEELGISWGPASDEDGNLAGYVLERSVDGSAWTEIYRGSMRAFTDMVTMGLNTIQYRVKAYDAAGDESGYISTETKTVINNRPPAAPASIIVPETIHGGSTITVSWSQAADEDGNLSGYTLEQCVNSGGWEEISNTTAFTADVPITFGWQTVQFRVRAYDTYGAVGQYATSGVVTVINNRAPVISGEDRDLGAMTAAFVPVAYIVDDPDGDEVGVTVKLDGIVKDTFTAKTGEENAFDIPADEWRKLLNGDHTIEVIAQDRPLEGTEGKQSIRTFTFVKTVRTIGFRLVNPMAADAMPEKCILSVQGSFPEGCILRIEVCNNANDAEPVWDDITQKVLTGQKHFFKNSTKTAEAWGVGVRASLERGTAAGDCYIHSLRGNYA